MSNRKKRKPQQQKPQQQVGQDAIDFDSLRKKKSKARRELPPVRIGGKNYRLKPKVPLAVTEYFAANAKRDGERNVTILLSDMQNILRVLFGERQWEEIAQEIELPDVPVLFNAVLEAYEESPGESSNSGQS